MIVVCGNIFVVKCVVGNNSVMFMHFGESNAALAKYIVLSLAYL